MINNILPENQDASSRIANNYDSAQKYNTDFGNFKMLTISNKMIRLANVSLKDNILEIGGGTGELTIKYSNEVCSVVVSDINPYMISIIQRKANEKIKKNINYALIDAKKTPFKDNSFNVVLERNLPLIYENKFISDGSLINVLNEMKRVSNDKVILIQGKTSPLHRKRNDVHLFNEKELKSILEDNLKLFNVKIITATFLIPGSYYCLGERISRKIEDICENNILLKKLGGCLIACGSKTEGK